MTGAGFSGCAIALVDKDCIEDLNDIVLNYYKEKENTDPTRQQRLV